MPEPQFAKNPFEYHSCFGKFGPLTICLDPSLGGVRYRAPYRKEPKVKKIKINKNTLRCTNSATMHYQQK